MICKNCFPGGLRKAVTFSFDDGVRQDLRLMDLFRSHGIKATFNLNSGMFDGDHTWNYKNIEVSRLSREEVEENYRPYFPPPGSRKTFPRRDHQRGLQRPPEPGRNRRISGAGNGISLRHLQHGSGGNSAFSRHLLFPYRKEHTFL